MPCCQIVHDFYRAALLKIKYLAYLPILINFVPKNGKNVPKKYQKSTFWTEKRVLPPAMVDFHILMRELVEQTGTQIQTTFQISLLHTSSISRIWHISILEFSRLHTKRMNTPYDLIKTNCLINQFLNNESGTTHFQPFL